MFKRLQLLTWLTILCPFIGFSQQLILEFDPTPTAGGTPGTTVDIHLIAVDGFEDIESFQWAYEWDPGLLSFDETVNIHPELTTVGNFSSTAPSFGLTDTASGYLYLSWLMLIDGGVPYPATIPDGDTVMTLRYIVNSDQPASVTIGDANGGTVVEVINSNNDDLEVIVNGAPSTDLTLTVGQGAGNAGDEICLPITVDNFNDITVFQFSIAWDPTELEYSHITNINSTLAMNSSSFGPNQVGVSSGEWGLLWQTSATDNTGITLPDGDTIISVCFDILNNSMQGDTLAVGFGNAPFPPEFIDTVGLVTPVLVDGFVRDTTSTIPAGNEFQVYSAPDCPYSVAKGDTVTVTLQANNWDSLNVMQWMMDFDTLVFKLDRASFLIPFDNSASFITKFREDTVRYAWVNDTISRADSLGFATFDFIAVGDVGESTNIRFFGDAVYPIEVISDVTPVPYSFQDIPLSIKEPLSLGTPAISSASCGNTGSIDITPTGGSGSYSFAWTGPNSYTNDTEDISGLASGDYTVVLSSDCDDDITQTFTVNGSSSIDYNENITNLTCNNDMSGAIALNVSGVTVSTIEWSNGDTGNSISGLSAGSYMVTVTDDNTCEYIETFVVTEPTALSAQVLSVQNEAIGGGVTGANGIGNVAGSGGTGQLLYTWIGGNISGSTSGSVQTNLSAAQYTVVVSDAVGCTNMLTVDIGLLEASIASTDISCNGQEDGTITINATSSTSSPINYGWNPNLGNQSSHNGIAAGNYSVIVSDNSAATVQLSVTINEPTALGVTLDNVQHEVDGNDGAIYITPQGGTPDYTYSWSDSSTDQDLVDVVAGSYSVTITDENGCTTTYSETILDNTSSPVVPQVTVSTNNIDCFMGTDGSINLNIGTDGAPFTISGIGSDQTSNGGSVVFDDLTAGVYNINVLSASGGDTTFMVTLTSPAQLKEVSRIINNENVPPGGNGAIELTMEGGIDPYHYQWSGPNGYTNTGSAIINQLVAGQYYVTVNDENGCVTIVGPIEVKEVITAIAPSYTGSIVNPSTCVDPPTGTIDVSFDRGVLYDWTGPNGFTSDEEDLTGLSAGVYSLTVTSGQGLTTTWDTTITVISSLTGNIAIDSDYNGFNVSGVSAADGVATATPADGISPYQFLWSSGETDETALELVAGINSVTITDDVGCSFIMSVDLSAPTSIGGEATSNGEYPGVSCFNTCDGQARIDAEGGVKPYTIAWDNGDTGPQASLLCPGEHTVTVTDANGSTYTSSVTILEPDPITIDYDIVDVTSIGVCDGAATILPTGGTPPYSFQWLHSGDTDDFVDQLCAGDKNLVLIVDANGCETLDSVSVSFPEGSCFSASIIISPQELDGYNDYFIMNCASQYSDNKLQIFNRWGQMVWQHEGYDCERDQSSADCWGGTNLSGKYLPEGGYFWIFEYTDDDGIRQQEKGAVTLVR